MNNAPIADGMTGSEIAIIGMSARFPGARDIDAFWRNLCAGEPSITFFSDAECNAAGVDLARISHRWYGRRPYLMA
jgi:phthiocerol/phenolphthiocerol synthesis type-I polyketide synthase E